MLSLTCSIKAKGKKRDCECQEKPLLQKMLEREKDHLRIQEKL